jgi:hypothetical protein
VWPEGLGLFTVLFLIINLQLVRENFEEIRVMNVCKTSEIIKKLYHCSLQILNTIIASNSDSETCESHKVNSKS